MSKKEKTVYDLELHERIHWNDLSATRVPGGWLYSEYDCETFNTVFVPYTVEVNRDLGATDEPTNL